jgi:hypothetical protein
MELVRVEFTNLVLETTLQQVAAQALYRRHGYHEHARFTKKQFTVLSFHKSLTPRSSGELH